MWTGMYQPWCDRGLGRGRGRGRGRGCRRGRGRGCGCLQNIVILLLILFVLYFRILLSARRKDNIFMKNNLYVIVL